MVHGINPTQGTGGVGDSQNAPNAGFSVIYKGLLHFGEVMHQKLSVSEFNSKFKQTLEEGLGMFPSNKNINLNQILGNFDHLHSSYDPIAYLNEFIPFLFNNVIKEDTYTMGLVGGKLKSLSYEMSCEGMPEDTMKVFVNIISTLGSVYHSNDFIPQKLIQESQEAAQKFENDPSYNALNNYLKLMQDVFDIH